MDAQHDLLSEREAMELARLSHVTIRKNVKPARIDPILYWRTDIEALASRYEPAGPSGRMRVKGEYKNLN